jgi:hypothetical protein
MTPRGIYIELNVYDDPKGKYMGLNVHVMVNVYVIVVGPLECVPKYAKKQVSLPA